VTTEEINEVKLSGVWKSGKGEQFSMLLHVGKYSVWGNYFVRGSDMAGEVHFQAEVLEMVEGAGFPRRLDMVLPKRGYMILVDSLFQSSTKTSEIMVAGSLYKKSPLESVTLSAPVFPSTSDLLAPRVQQPIHPPDVRECPDPMGSAGGTTFELPTGDRTAESSSMSDDTPPFDNQDIMDVWSSIMHDFEEPVL